MNSRALRATVGLSTTILLIGCSSSDHISQELLGNQMLDRQNAAQQRARTDRSQSSKGNAASSYSGYGSSGSVTASSTSKSDLSNSFQTRQTQDSSSMTSAITAASLTGIVATILGPTLKSKLSKVSEQFKNKKAQATSEKPKSTYINSQRSTGNSVTQIGRKNCSPQKNSRDLLERDANKIFEHSGPQ